MNYEIIPSKEVIEKTAAALTGRGFEVTIVENKQEALEKVKSFIPAGASVTTGSSRSLEEIGFIDYLKGGEHGWNNLKAAIVAESNPEKQAELRRQSVHADYFLVSTHALTEEGELLNASASGSQLPSIAFTSPNLIFVVSTNKIVPNLDEALKRIREYVVPLEDERMKSTGAPGTVLSKLLIFEREPAFMNRKVRIVLVNEKLGF